MKKTCETSSQDLAKMTPTLIEQMLYLGIPLRTNHQYVATYSIPNSCSVEIYNLVVWSYQKRFLFDGNWKLTQITFSLHWLAAGADFEL